jgi:lysyl oxidase
LANKDSLIPYLKPIRGHFLNAIDDQIDAYSLVNPSLYEMNERKVLQFSIAIANIGHGSLTIQLGDVIKNDQGKEIAPAKQILFRKNVRGGLEKSEEVDVGYFEKHIEKELGTHGHVHWHYSKLASIELLGENNEIVANSKKDKFCLIDSFKIPRNRFSIPKDANVPFRQQFTHEGGCELEEVKDKGKSGLSVGWADYYHYGTTDQFIDIDDIKSGFYTIQLKVNKTKLICEIDKPAKLKVLINKEDMKVIPVLLILSSTEEIYKKGELITIRITNEHTESIKFKDKIQLKIYDDKAKKIINTVEKEIIELKPYKSITIEWNQADGNNKQVAEGSYKVVLEYTLPNNNNTLVSDLKFEIK